MKKIGIVIGTRPEIIKMAPLIIEAKERGYKVCTIHSSQHYDKNMSEDYYKAFGIGYDLSSPLPEVWIKYFEKQGIRDVFVHGDTDTTFLISGNGDVIEPDENVIAIGSGGVAAQAAATALAKHAELDAEQIVREAMAIAASLCVYTNDSLTVEIL